MSSLVCFIPIVCVCVCGGTCKKIRYPLAREVMRQIQAKNKRRAPEMTTKQGKLKADRKAKLQRIYLDDLASLENFSIVITFFSLSLSLVFPYLFLIAHFYIKGCYSIYK